jgi:hypothetical protein
VLKNVITKKRFHFIASINRQKIMKMNEINNNNNTALGSVPPITARLHLTHGVQVKSVMFIETKQNKKLTKRVHYDGFFFSPLTLDGGFISPSATVCWVM